MFKGEQDALVTLVKSLTKAEKRHFKLYSRRNAGKAEPLFLKLFDAIDRQGRYVEEAILKSTPEIKRSQLPNLRSKLNKEILVALRLLQRNQTPDIAVREQLDFASILYARGMYHESLNLLEKAKQRALKYSMHPLALEIVALEKHIESQYITRSTEGTAEDLATTSHWLSQAVQRESIYSSMSLQLYGRYLKMGHARNEKEVAETKAYFNQLLPDYEIRDMGFHDRLYLFQSYIWLFSITHEFPMQYRYSQKWLDLFDQFPEILPTSIPLYLRGLHNMLNVQFLTLRYRAFCKTFAVLETFNQDGGLQLSVNETSLYLMYYHIHRLNKHFLEGTFTDGVTWVPDLVALLESDEVRWDRHRVMVFYYKVACLYFSAGDNHTAIEYLNRIINKVTPDFREDIQCFARVLSLIAHFELGNALLVSHQLKTVYRFLLRMRELSATMSEIITFLRRTRNILPSELKGAFIELKVRLEEVSQHPFERRAALYLDITSWLDSKIEGRPVEDVIREKFVARGR